jgi:hypothetical protein
MGDLLKGTNTTSIETQKLPWQMTKAEYEAIHGSPRGNSTVTGYFSRHRDAVALNRGLPVPEEVLKDYPELFY